MEYGERVDYGESRGVYRTVGDEEHINVEVPDGKADMRDISQSAKAFGSYPGHERRNPNADINNDAKVDMKDIGTIAKEFGKTA